MTDRKRHSVNIPVSATETEMTDVTLYLPAEMTSGEWNQMQHVLTAMKPVLVRTRAQLASDEVAQILAAGREPADDIDR